MTRSTVLGLGVLVAVCVVGCERAPDSVGSTQAQREFMAVGVFNSVDPKAGTVNISHQPVPAAGWPAMTMDFKLADVEDAGELKPGDRVDLHFTVENGMNATITELSRIE